MVVFSYELRPETCAIVIFMCELVYISNKKKGVNDASSPFPHHRNLKSPHNEEVCCEDAQRPEQPLGKDAKHPSNH